MDLQETEAISRERRTMLVLSRKTNESIVIGENVTVTVVEIRGDKVRLGIDAPEAVSVDRQEIRARKKAEAAAPLVRSPLLGSMPAVAVAFG